MKPKISIIVPVFNVEKYLHRCVDSIINQSFQNLEIILINDGSLDGSGLICDIYSQLDNRVLVIHQKNQGLSGARNSGLNIASGNYIGFVDSDDWVEKDMFKTMLQALKKYDADIVECNLLETTGTVRSSFRYDSVLIIEDRLQALRRIVKNQNFSVWRRLYTKKSLENIFFVKGKNSEDVYFTYQVFKQIKKSVYLSSKFYNYFIGDESITRGAYKIKTLDSIDAALYLYERVQKEEDIELKLITRIFLLKILLYNYKMLNYYSLIDDSFKHRKFIKNLIIENYIQKSNTSFQLTLARFLPITVFEYLIRLYSQLRPLHQNRNQLI
ncbi:glycosyltransferase [Mangrovimonas sp. TPBH4]|uniref:glycosyltransferase n=1 Tax=Mangrovimonas sp. TPBH4 TaxID=1645914 RepID=UPI0006B69689|nr:glycosyltransferase [Mangrovimonas sp. TPBH4]